MQLAKYRHSMLRLDATQKKRWLGFDFKFKKFSIKQAIFTTEIISFQVKVHTQFFFEIFKTFLNNKISNCSAIRNFAHTRKTQKFSREQFFFLLALLSGRKKFH